MADRLDVGLKAVAEGCKILVKKMEVEGFKPDLIVGIAKGGLMAAYFLAKHYGCPIYSTNISSYKGKKR